MTLNFCTLFDSHFLASGYTMYSSLKQQCSDFHLYIFAFDDLAAEVLKQLNLPCVTVVTLDEFEDEELLRVKPTRNKGEYCWTCTASTIKYSIEKFNLDHCIYVDADLYFYDDPNLIVQDVLNAQKDVLITSHNYAKKYDKSKISGKYCVQFMYFKNTADSLNVLNWWRNACLEWCYNRIEDGKFGDQKYLDDWLTRYSCVHECSLPGAGIAPWNAYDYDLIENQNHTYSIKSRKSNRESRLIFYHYHKVRLFSNAIIWGIGYFLPKKFRRHLYLPYSHTLLQNAKDLQQTNKNFNLLKNNILQYKKEKIFDVDFLKDLLRYFYYRIRIFNAYHIYKIKKWQNY